MKQTSHTLQRQILAVVIPGMSLGLAVVLLLVYSINPSSDSLVQKVGAQYIFSSSTPNGTNPTKRLEHEAFEKFLSRAVHTQPTDIVSRTIEDQNLDTHSVANDAFFIASSGRLTITEQVGREMFGTFLALRQEGKLSEDKKKWLIEKVTQHAASLMTPRVTTIDNLTVTEDLSPESLKEYQKGLDSILAPTRTLTTHEMMLFARIYELNDINALSELSRTIAVYKTFLTGAENMRVPAPLASSHADMVSSVRALTEDLEGLMAMETDPLRTFIVVGRIATHVQQVEDSFARIGNFLSQHANSQ